TPTRWRCMVKPGKKFRLGAIVHLGSATGTVAGIEENGDRWIEWDQPVDEERHGHLALPHYMGRPDNSTDRQRYQTVFAREPGSIAAPTAGLHFTPDILAQLPHSFVTLHVGVGTFQPVRTDRVEDHVMHAETYEIPADTATRIRAARRVVAVGTTALRTLETVAAQPGGIRATTGSTDIFIYPGYTFRCVQALL
ncbi:MAG: S-adenosylmethionine:tRNA ribosyltransferase-isomerase, partial [Verrucomicrobiales bacterium]|nr:S-adenosylmethionine:tRNA ribosyltransferase-isomerase [Verrucomicrobiales bacterium]